MNDTIAAIATASGVASIAIVRISGPDAYEIARRMSAPKELDAREARLSTIYDMEGEIIDRGILIYFPSPRSFTGEDIVEFQVHGGMVVAQRVLESAIHFGARHARPGEFSKRAYLNGKIDLSEAEAIASLIEARSLDAARILLRQMRGELGRFVERVREGILTVRAYSEVSIDYAEEDIPPDILEAIEAGLQRLSCDMQRVLNSSERRRGLIEGFRIAIVGRPNVGKSSLLNALLDYERAIVSDIAGTTRDTIEEQIRVGTHIVRIVDTAGIRDARDEIERRGVNRSLESIEEADIVIALFDSSREYDEDEDGRILRLIEGFEKERLIVALNKSDLPRRFNTEILAPFPYIEISAKREFTRLMSELEKRLDGFSSSDELMLVNERQMDAVRRCAKQIEEAREPLRRGELEIFSYHLAEAASAIGEISRPYESEEILDRMFSEFCLGK